MPVPLSKTSFLSSMDLKHCGSVVQPTDSKRTFITEIKSDPMSKNHTVESYNIILITWITYYYCTFAHLS